MSGVVLVLNDDNEIEDEPTSIERNDEDENLLPGSDYPDDKWKNISRHRRKYNPVGSHGGSFIQLLNTLTLCCAFFGLGLTKSLIDPGVGHDYESPKQMASSVGYLVGFLLGGFLYGRFSKFFLLLLTSLILGVSLFFIPWTTSLWLVDTVYAIIGICGAIIMIGGNAICLDFWGQRSGPYIQSIHFCMSLGLLTGPLLIDPLAQTKVPSIVQKALPPHVIMNSTDFNIYERSRNKREIDPILLTIFDESSSKPPLKLKPTFTDGRKLDNSRDWDKVKIKTVEEVIPDVTTTTESIRTTEIDSSLEEILSFADVEKRIDAKVKPIDKSIRVLLDNSADSTIERNKRSLFRNNRNNNNDPMRKPTGPFNRPYERPFIPSPRFPMIPPNINWEDPNYDNYDLFNEDYVQPDSKFKKPPEKVEEAIETIAEYLNNPSKGPNNTHSTTTSISVVLLSTKPTTVVPSKSTIPTSRRTTIKKKEISSTTVKSIRMKPMSSFDNDTEKEGVTILTVLNGYGVSHKNVGFILDAAYTLIISVIFLLCLCYNPREPRERILSTVSSDSKEENRIFKSTVTVLLFFFSLIHWGMFVSFREILPRFTILSSSAIYLQQVFIGIFTAARFLAIFVANLIPTAAGVFVALTITFVGSLVLVFTQQISASAVWASVILQAVGLSTLLPQSLVWGETYISMSASVISIIGCGMALGELGVPHLLTLLTLEAQTWLGFATVGATTLCGGLFLCAFLVARKHGIRNFRPRLSGYELAAQEEITGELLEDVEDDFEMSEPNMRDEDEIDTSNRSVPA